MANLERVTVLYRAFLRLYPADLSREYGEEMVLTFQQVVRDEYRRRGARGVMLVSGRALSEIFTVALPRHLKSDWLIAASLSLLITSGVLGLLVGVMTAHVRVMPPGTHVAMRICR